MSLDNKHHDNRKRENMYIACKNTLLLDLTLTSLTHQPSYPHYKHISGDKLPNRCARTQTRRSNSHLTRVAKAPKVQKPRDALSKLLRHHQHHSSKQRHDLLSNSGHSKPYDYRNQTISTAKRKNAQLWLLPRPTPRNTRRTRKCSASTLSSCTRPKYSTPSPRTLTTRAMAMCTRSTTRAGKTRTYSAVFYLDFRVCRPCIECDGNSDCRNHRASRSWRDDGTTGIMHAMEVATLIQDYPLDPARLIPQATAQIPEATC
jgi:hypothetical protein